SNGTGSRFPIPVTRAVVSAAQSGALINRPTSHLDILNLDFPQTIPEVDQRYVDPRSGWERIEDYNSSAMQLGKLFQENIIKFDVSSAIANAGPRLS
ncbi:MAG: phosphoenolpyruvate carboxykinase (ATP), partial [Euryarchaeota archaeon TMED255]